MSFFRVLQNESFSLSFFWFFIGLTFFDQLTKYTAFKFIQNVETGGVLDFSLFRNNNFAFSLPVPVLVMYFIYFTVLLSLTAFLLKKKYLLSKLELIAWVLILAGGVSNVLERLVLGYVRDFIKIANGFFNLADFYIFIGVALILFYPILTRRSSYSDV